jgi:hypothetical protein
MQPSTGRKLTAIPDARGSSPEATTTRTVKRLGKTDHFLTSVEVRGKWVLSVEGGVHIT